MTAITIDEVTTQETDGTGAFDQLMESVNVQLDRQYKKQRINGPDFAKVYLGALQSVLSESIKFVLNKQQSDKQAELLDQQRLKTIEETALVEQQVLVAQQEVLKSQAEVQRVEQEIVNLTVQSQILVRQSEKLEQDILVAAQEVLNMQQQVLKSAAEVALITKQGLKIDKENLILDYNLANTLPAEHLVILANQALITNQASTEISKELNVDANTALLSKQGLKVDQEVLNMQQEVINMAAEKLKIDKEVELMTARVANETAQLTILTNQAAKLDAEKDLLIEKKWVEQAQYLDTVNSGSVAGVIGKQKDLYTAQKDGFARDAEQKLTKILVDSWNVRKSALPDTTPADNTNKLGDSNIGSIVNKAAAGIGVTL